MDIKAEGFDNPDDALARIQEIREDYERSVALLDEKQRSITWGSYWVRFYQDLVIFGYVMTLDEVRASEVGDVSDITDPVALEAIQAEVEYTLRTIEATHTAGYMYGWCNSSVAEEIGSTHQAQMWPIDRAVYEHAREHRWDVDKIRPIFRLELAGVFQEYHDWALRAAEGFVEEDGGGEGGGPR